MKPLRYETARRLASWYNLACGGVALIWFLAWVVLAIDGRPWPLLAFTALSIGWLPPMLLNMVVQTFMTAWDVKRQDAAFEEILAELNTEHDRVMTHFAQARRDVH